MKSGTLVTAVLLAAAGASPTTSHAALGTIPEVYQDMPQAATAKTGRETHSSYSAQHDLIQNGIEVDQYIDAGNRVFAVSWHGPGKPDLRRLFGDRLFATLSDPRASAVHASRHSTHFQSDEFVLQGQSHGHDFRGRAWIPALLPAGFSPGMIK